MNLSCLIGRHNLGPWQLRPRLIGARVEWLRWERACTRQVLGSKPWRCSHVERRWFRIHVPANYRGQGIGKALDVDAYLRELRTAAPVPETLSTGVAPPAQAIRSLEG